MNFLVSFLSMYICMSSVPALPPPCTVWRRLPCIHSVKPSYRYDCQLHTKIFEVLCPSLPGRSESTTSSCSNSGLNLCGPRIGSYCLGFYMCSSSISHECPVAVVWIALTSERVCQLSSDVLKNLNSLQTPWVCQIILGSFTLVSGVLTTIPSCSPLGMIMGVWWLCVHPVLVSYVYKYYFFTEVGISILIPI